MRPAIVVFCCVPVIVCLFLGCAAPPQLQDAPGLSVYVGTGDAFEAPTLRLDQYGTLCWWNSAEGDDSNLVVSLDRPVGSSAPCRTVTLFKDRDGHAVTEPGIPPSDCAILCFHHAGTFQYRMTRGDRTVEGEIQVVAREE